jgi:two-component system sensor histidine kinase YesM
MFQKAKDLFQDLKLEKKILFAYIVFATIFFVASVTALQASLRIYDERLYEKSLQELDYFTQEVNRGLEEVENLSYTIAMDTEVQERLADIMQMNAASDAYAYEMYRFRSVLINELNAHPTVMNIVYTDKRKTRLKVGIDCGEISDHVYADLLAEFDTRKGGYAFVNPTTEYRYLISGRNILEKSNATLNYLGSILLTSDIAGLIEQKNDSLEAPHSTLFVCSENGMIYGSETDMPMKLSGEDIQGYKIIRHQGQKAFVCYLKSSFTGWTYVNMFPYSEIYGQTMMVRYWLLTAFIIIFLVTLMAMKRISHIIMKPLEQLTTSIHIAEQGDFQEAQVAIEQRQRKDEVGRLAEDFQTMLGKIDRLIDENYKKQILLKDTKYKVLQAQINPHFLNNTLNSLHWMMKAGRNKEAGKMIVQLGDLLRASFSEDPYISVQEELLVVRNYISIQQLRYKNRAEFHITAEGSLDDYIMPRMTLQPLVENAISHGVEVSLDVCRVSVAAREERDTITFEVSDSGPGISAEELLQVRDFSIKPKGHGIGLKNIRQRLDIMFPSSVFEIESEPGRGTSIKISIPKRRKGESHV